MPSTQHNETLRIPDLLQRKGGEPIVCLTAYTTPIARLAEPFVDLLLVGDSLGNVLHGMETTLGVTLELMIAHGKAVGRGVSRVPFFVDMPFGSYQRSPEQAFDNAVRIMRETGCTGVKLEGGREMAETVAFLTARGIPVMGHVGLLPQSIHALGGYRARGRSDAECARIMDGAKSIAEAGAFATVIESVDESLAREITKAVPNLTIGIGASNACDGQILVTEDILGMNPNPPRFVKQYAELGEATTAAIESYAEDVRARRFPGPEHVYRLKS